jgi:hypothetical protein
MSGQLRRDINCRKTTNISPQVYKDMLEEGGDQLTQGPESTPALGSKFQPPLPRFPCHLHGCLLHPHPAHVPFRSLWQSVNADLGNYEDFDVYF